MAVERAKMELARVPDQLGALDKAVPVWWGEMLDDGKV